MTEKERETLGFPFPFKPSPTMIDYAENGVVSKGHSFAHSFAPQRSAPLRSVPLRFAPLHSAPLRAAPLTRSLTRGNL